LFAHRTRLADDDVKPDETDKLVIALRRANVIDGREMVRLLGVCGVQLQPLVDALKSSMLQHAVLHADETPVAMLKPGNKKTHRAYPTPGRCALRDFGCAL
jgi:transposase